MIQIISMFIVPSKYLICLTKKILEVMCNLYYPLLYLGVYKKCNFRRSVIKLKANCAFDMQKLGRQRKVISVLAIKLIIDFF